MGGTTVALSDYISQRIYDAFRINGVADNSQSTDQVTVAVQQEAFKTNFGLIPIDVPVGNIDGVTGVNKFGYAPSGVQTTNTDIWDRADAVPTQQIWSAPKTARTMTIVSTSVSDALDAGGSPGAGARTLRIWGIIDWDTIETTEDIDLDGTTGVVALNKYIIIHRMSVLTYGNLGPNVGTITITASVTTDIVAQINPGWGQTEMAIYGFSSLQDAYLTNWYASLQKSSGTAADVNFKLLFAIDVINNPDIFITREIRGLQSTGNSNGIWEKNPYKKFIGPGIIKVQAIGSAADIDCTAGFDLILVDK